ncbi:MAG TPA: hypothetical protein VN397_01550 [Candidatus Methylomirabilis sp.]|nr:hypothetical protein [Candidatus Methylomirabilis sp.]
MKWIIVIATAIAALAWFAGWDGSTARKAASATGEFLNEPVRHELVQTDSCPPWCEHGCMRVKGSLVKVCK